jgi:hypothetical protein
MTLASSEQRNNTRFAKSSVFTHLLKSEFGIAFLLASVSIILGNMQFTLMLCSFTSSEIDSTSLIRPDFEAMQNHNHQISVPF